MKDLLGNELKKGDTAILGTRNDNSGGFAALRACIVVNPSFTWGHELRVLVHSLDPRFLKYKKQKPSHRVRGVKPENLIKVTPATFSKAIQDKLQELLKSYRRKIRVKDLDKAETEKNIREDIENI